MKTIFALLLGVLLVPQLTFAMPTEAFVTLLRDKENCGKGVYDPPRKVVYAKDNYSYGDYCFKPTTLHGMGLKYGLWDKTFTLKEAELLLQNKSVQKAIVRFMYEDGTACTYAGWYNSCRKLGLAVL